MSSSNSLTYNRSFAAYLNILSKSKSELERAKNKPNYAKDPNKSKSDFGKKWRPNTKFSKMRHTGPENSDDDDQLQPPPRKKAKRAKKKQSRNKTQKSFFLKMPKDIPSAPRGKQTKLDQLCVPVAVILALAVRARKVEL